MRKTLAVTSICALFVGACASAPKQTLLTLDQADPLYNTPGCVQARQAALDYDDKVLGRAATGVLLGLMGPIGLIAAVGVDANQNNQRAMLNQIVQRECQTTPAATPEAAAD